MADAVHADTLIAIKAYYEGTSRRFKLPLRDLGAYTFPEKIRQVLSLSDRKEVVLERYSDSAAKWVILDSENTAIYKQLYRAAKAKLKLRIKVTEQIPIPDPEPKPELKPESDQPSSADDTVSPAYRGSYLNTVLNGPSLQPGEALPLPKFPTLSDSLQKAIDEIPARLDPYHPSAEDTSTRPAFYIDCNSCGNSIPAAHWHCSICEDGDYDLCQACVDAGVSCPGVNHWLIKRIVINGTVVHSTTETLAPASRHQPASPVMGAPTPEPQREPQSEPEAVVEGEAEESPLDTVVEEPQAEAEQEPEAMLRTCNACFEDFSETLLVTCRDCQDYDLCFSCLVDDNHGHHPAHTFDITNEESLDEDDVEMKRAVESLCRPGRNVVHAALCDGCDKRVRGVRHKCLDCPDFDYCSLCFRKAAKIHFGHRFVPIYEPIAAANQRDEVHYGIYCDGPLCKESSSNYITGARFKCAICHDLDFCANCEAHPDNTHNRTHPLLKFKTAVRHVSVCTLGEDDNGQLMRKMGDNESENTATLCNPTPQVPVSHAATQVQKSVEADPPAPASPQLTSSMLKEEKEPAPGDLATWGMLQARIVKETVPDETKIRPGTVFTQTFTLRNPGPTTWPEGCVVRFSGGDSMFNIDENHPTSTSNLHLAMESALTTEPVDPHGFAEFTLTLKAPTRLGRAISYWRLKTPDGVPFGDRMWCDLIVTSENLPDDVLNSEDADQEEEAGSEKERDVDSETADEDPLAGSDMVFPKLEKESPESSIIEDTPAKDSDEHDLAEDLESLTMDDDSDAFLTDEEYDILDASDQEFPVSPEKQQK